MGTQKDNETIICHCRRFSELEINRPKSIKKKITLTLVIQNPAYTVAVNPIPAGRPTYIIIEIQGQQQRKIFPGSQIRDLFSLSVNAYLECGIHNI